MHVGALLRHDEVPRRLDLLAVLLPGDLRRGRAGHAALEHGRLALGHVLLADGQREARRPRRLGAGLHVRRRGALRDGGRLDEALGLAAGLARRVDGHALVRAGVLRQRLDDDERVHVVLVQDLVADVRRDLPAALQPVNVHRLRPGDLSIARLASRIGKKMNENKNHLGVETNQLTGLHALVLDGGEERGRDEASAAGPTLLHDEVGAALGAAAAVLGDRGEDARVLHEHLADDEHGLGAERVDLELGRVLDGEVLAVPRDLRGRVALELDLEAGALVLEHAARLDLLREERRHCRFLFEFRADVKSSCRPYEHRLTTGPWTTRSWVRALCSTSVVSVAVILRVISSCPFTSFCVCFCLATCTSRP